MLADEVRRAERGRKSTGIVRTARRWFQTRAVARPSRGRPNVVRALVETSAAWDGPDLVALTDEHLVFDAPNRRRQSALRTVASVTWEGDLVCVCRHRAHDWLIYLKDERDAESVWLALGEAIAPSRG